MKKSFYNILSALVIITFLLYWIIVFILSMPANPAGKMIAKNAPRFKTTFGFAWKLFTPPYTYNSRLYFISRSIKEPGKTDTLEVLEHISLKKQQMAPFNQKENIIDYLVNNTVAGILKTVWHDKKSPIENLADTPDSARVALAIANVANSKSYVAYLASLNNYCKMVLKENKIDTAGREGKIIIKQKMMRPFKEMYNQQFVQQEMLVFETPYKPVSQ